MKPLFFLILFSFVRLSIGFTQKVDPKIFEYHLSILDKYLSTHPDSALYHADQYLTLAEKIGDDEKIARAIRKKGIIEFNKANYSSSLQYIQEAFEMYEERHDHSGMAACLNNYGVLYRFIADYDQALHYFILAMEEYRILGHDQMVATTNFNIGSIYEEIEDYQKALTYFGDSYVAAERHGNAELMGIVQIHAGNVLIHRGNSSKAIKAYHKAIENFEKENRLILIAETYGRLADYYLSVNKYDSTVHYVDKALSLVKPETIEAIESIQACYRIKALLYDQKGQYDSAEHYGLKALALVEPTGVKKEIYILLGVLAGIYEHQQNMDKALIYNKRFFQLKDSIFNQESSKRIRDIEVKYQTERKQREIELLTIKSNFQQKIILIGIVTTVLIVLVLILIYNRTRLKNRLLEQQKTIEVERNFRMKEELDAKNRELTTHAVHLIEKNEMLDNVKSKLLNTSASIIQSNNELKDALKLVNSNLNLSKDWQQLKLHFENVHPHFFERTQTLGHKLSQNELKHCAYIKMKLSVKEVARMLNVEEKSVRMSHYRIKKKLSVTDPTSLSEFIASI